jgi:uncharacterized membrane protein
LDLSDWICNSGIILEIIGFILILVAVRARPRGETFIEESISQFKNVMTTQYPWLNFVGIGLVIIGLILQLVSSFY